MSYRNVLADTPELAAQFGCKIGTMVSVWHDETFEVHPAFKDMTAAEVQDHGKPQINGWTPPTLYDIHTDTIRIATQRDVDRLQAAEQMLGQMVSGMRKLLHEFDCKRQALVLEQFSKDHLKPISECLDANR